MSTSTRGEGCKSASLTSAAVQKGAALRLVAAPEGTKRIEEETRDAAHHSRPRDKEKQRKRNRSASYRGKSANKKFDVVMVCASYQPCGKRFDEAWWIWGVTAKGNGTCE